MRGNIDSGIGHVHRSSDDFAAEHGVRMICDEVVALDHFRSQAQLASGGILPFSRCGCSVYLDEVERKGQHDVVLVCVAPRYFLLLLRHTAKLTPLPPHPRAVAEYPRCCVATGASPALVAQATPRYFGIRDTEVRTQKVLLISWHLELWLATGRSIELVQQYLKRPRAKLIHMVCTLARLC